MLLGQQGLPAVPHFSVGHAERDGEGEGQRVSAHNGRRLQPAERTAHARTPGTGRHFEGCCVFSSQPQK